MVRIVGQRSNTETLFGIVAAFIDRKTWSQTDLATKLETRSETVRKYLLELQGDGFPFEREEDHPNVYWSVPKNWFPGALAFKAEEARDLLRLIARSPRGALRNRVVQTATARLATGSAGAALSILQDPAATIQPTEMSPEEEKWLPLIEDAAVQRVTLNMRYYSASTGREQWRHASVHRIDVGARAQFIATCHRADELRRFRVSNVLDARLDKRESFRSTTAAALAKFDRESFGGFRDVGPSVECAFVVRNPEAAWVAKNLPDKGFEQESIKEGVRFTITTAGVAVLARFVAGLGEVAWPETPELATEVASIARAALANAMRGLPTPAPTPTPTL